MIHAIVAVVKSIKNAVYSKLAILNVIIQLAFILPDFWVKSAHLYAQTSPFRLEIEQNRVQAE